ncbi:MAG: DUF1016 family protein [Bacteroidales bacterium]|nr:DUF1016 family protein [Bacteroidales bacterium]
MSISALETNYIHWLGSVKDEIRRSQIKAAVSVNSELIMLYWNLGRQITEMQKSTNWGDKFIEQLSHDLLQEFPTMKGLSVRNLQTCRKFYLFYNQNIFFTKQPVSQKPCCVQKEFAKQPVSEIQTPDNQHVLALNNEQAIGKQVVSQFDVNIFGIPWGHHILIMQRCKDIDTAIFYIRQTIQNNWSRSVLEYHIESKLIEHQGNSTNNFKLTLPAPQSDLANEILKSHYNFDFLNMSKRVRESELETALVNNITDFLLALGQGFAYMGRQFLLRVGQKDYRTDLLFYHTKLRCYIVIELKTKEFEPEFVGKLSFYTSAINKLVKNEQDNPTIGVLLCKSKDDFEVEIALQDINKPIGVSTYNYTTLPENMRPALEAFKQLQTELNKKAQK